MALLALGIFGLLLGLFLWLEQPWQRAAAYAGGVTPLCLALLQPFMR